MQFAVTRISLETFASSAWKWKPQLKKIQRKFFSLSYLAPCFAGEESRGGSATLTDKNCIFFAMQIMHFLTICIFSQLYFGQWQRVRFFYTMATLKKKDTQLQLSRRPVARWVSFSFFPRFFALNRDNKWTQKDLFQTHLLITLAWHWLLHPGDHPKAQRVLWSPRKNTRTSSFKFQRDGGKKKFC